MGDNMRLNGAIYIMCAQKTQETATIIKTRLQDSVWEIAGCLNVQREKQIGQS